MKIAHSRFIIFFISFYSCLDVICPLFVNKAVTTSVGIVYAVTFISAVGFVLEDIITELYGTKTLMIIAIISSINKLLFGLFCYFMLTLPSLATPDQAAFNYVLDRVSIISLITINAYFIARWLNSYFLIKWKIILKGRFFWLRSIITSGIFEILFVILAAIPHLYLSKSVFYHLHFIEIIIASCIVRLITNILLAFPASILVNIINSIENKPQSIIQLNPFHKTNMN